MKGYRNATSKAYSQPSFEICAARESVEEFFISLAGMIFFISDRFIVTQFFYDNNKKRGFKNETRYRYGIIFLTISQYNSIV